MNCQKVKKALVSFLIGASLIGGSVVTYANCLYVSTKTYVDSNTWTSVGGATKSTNGSYCTVKILEIYKADGSSSDYKYVKVKPTTNGTSTTCEKYKNKDITLPTAYQTAGVYVTYYCMGNNPRLDCMITGNFNSN